MKNNKLICVLLAMLVCLSLVVSVSATEDTEAVDLTYVLESSAVIEEIEAAVAYPGKTFSVNVVIESNPGFKMSTVKVHFDTEVLELVNAEAIAEDVAVNKLNGKVHVNIGDFDHLFNVTKVNTFTGVVARLTFKFIGDVDETTKIELEASKGGTFDANNQFGAITVNGDTLTANLVGTDHTCDENNTAEAEKTADEPTCTVAGKEANLLCAHCGQLVAEGATIPALGHTNGDVVVENEVAATCTADGKYENVVYCTVCEAEVSRETVTVPATGHAWGEFEITTEPGCKDFGVQTRTCATCGETESDNSVPATGNHTFGEWKVTVDATTEAEGEETRICAECGEKETRAIEKLPPVPVKKDNTLLIVIICVVVLAGAGVAAFFILKNKKK